VVSFRPQALVSSRGFDLLYTRPKSSILSVIILLIIPLSSYIVHFTFSVLVFSNQVSSPQQIQLSRMPSKPTKQTTATSSSSYRQVASSPTLTSSSSLSSAAMSKNASSYQTHTAAMSNYNPSAIESWMNGVSNNNTSNIGRKDSSNSSSAASLQMQDPAVQAYMAAKMGLFQQSTHSHSRPHSHSQSHPASGNN